MRKLLLLIVCTFALLFPATVYAQSVCDNPITSIPCQITSSGSWVLGGDIYHTSPTAHGITINADNVTIDFRQNRLVNAAGSATTATGVYANGRSGITLKNCNISGWFFGVRFDDSPPYYNGGHLLDNCVSTQSYYYGFYIQGADSTLHRVRAINTGGSTVTMQNPITCGIATYGRMYILDSSAIDTNPITINNECVGLSVSAGYGSIVDNFWAENATVYAGSYGIWVESSTLALILRSKIINYSYGIAFPTGARGVYQANLVYGAGTNQAFSISIPADVVDGGGNLTNQ